MTSLQPLSQAELDAFLTSWHPGALLWSALKTYWAPIGLALLRSTPIRDRLNALTAFSAGIPLALWSVIFAFGTLEHLTYRMTMWGPRFAVYSFLSLMPILMLFAVEQLRNRQSDRFVFGTLVGFGALLCDCALILLVLTPATLY